MACDQKATVWKMFWYFHATSKAKTEEKGAEIKSFLAIDR
jgi:hypothetical protein